MSEEPTGAYTRQDEAPDEEFYSVPRFVQHIDDKAIAAVTQTYREYLPADGEILDLMTSWISHLPEEVSYARVSGLGLNEEELRANPRLDDYKLQNLNENPALPYSQGEFDAASICVSVDYLTRPVEVLRDLGRVVRPGGPVAISFSNRCFPTKVVSAWLELDDRGRMELVESYLGDAGNWRDVQARDRSPRGFFSDPLYVVTGYSEGEHQAS